VTPKDSYDYKGKIYVFAYRPCVIRWRHTDNRHLRLEDIGDNERRFAVKQTLKWTWLIRLA